MKLSNRQKLRLGLAIMCMPLIFSGCLTQAAPLCKGFSVLEEMLFYYYPYCCPTLMLKSIQRTIDN